MWGAVGANLLIGLLLVFNIVVYYRLNTRLVWREMAADLAVGLALPALSYLFVLGGPSLIAKGLVSLGILFSLVAALMNGRFVERIVAESHTQSAISAQKS